MRRPHAVLALAAALASAGCEPDPTPPDLATLYRHAGGLDARDPVITIPGMLGSRLVDDDSGLVLWGGGMRLSADPADPVEARISAHPIGDPATPLRELRDAVRTDGVARIVTPSFLGLTAPIDIYQGLIRTLIAGGYDFRETRAEEIAEREVNLDAFEFPFDWRRDLVEAASDLAYFIDRKKRQVEEERLRVLGERGPPVKFDIVAHSMGALVARYFLMYGGADLPEDGSPPELTWAGAEHVDTVILIAPPHSGSVETIPYLIEGRSFGPLQPFYPAALLGTYPTMYQLMPRDRHNRVRRADGAPLGGLYDVETWVANGWGLADPTQAPVLATLMPYIDDPEKRRARAIGHLDKALKRAERFHAAIDRENRPPPDLDMYLVVGGGFQTPASVVWDHRTREVAVDAYEEGDFVVLRASALADERQDAETRAPGLVTPHAYRSILLLPREHVLLTLDPVFGDNLLFWLLEEERRPESLPADPGPAPRRLLAGLGGEAAARAPRAAPEALDAAR
mgnify:CR=1 FL=1